VGELFAYQRTGAKFLGGRHRALLADGMGLGKTPQAIAAADEIGARRVAVICPAVARINWRREFERWGEITDRDLFVESYDKVAQKGDAYSRIKDMQPDVLILDEAHYLKTRTSKRTKALYGQYTRGDGLVASAKRVWLLTGTPAPNDVSEIYSHLKALWPDLLPAPGTFEAFIKAFTVFDSTPFGIKILGNKNIAELRAKLAPIMLRRRAEDVLKDMPAITWTDVAIEAEAVKIDESQPEVVELLDAIKNDRPLPDSTAMASIRRLTGMAKAGAVAKMLAEELASKAYDKVIVFAHHRDVVRHLEEALREFNPVVIAGDTPPKVRQAAIDSFQDTPRVRVFIGNIQAASTAITLTAANQVVFAEASWTPADNAQAAKRAHRIGQTRPVFVRMISLAGSIDEAVTRVLARKSRLVSQLLEQEK
jgi:SWI/SNF-related matrix-associated actin-dependent regulator of chromatin subfamily A-like protein 1